MNKPTRYATRKFGLDLRGTYQTFELWLPLDLTPEEAEAMCEAVRKLATPPAAGPPRQETAPA